MVEREISKKEMEAVIEIADLVAKTVAKFAGVSESDAALALVLTNQHIAFGNATGKLADIAYLAGVQHGVGEAERPLTPPVTAR
jgi:hypothetical protein